MIIKWINKMTVQWINKMTVGWVCNKKITITHNARIKTIPEDWLPSEGKWWKLKLGWKSIRKFGIMSHWKLSNVRSTSMILWLKSMKYKKSRFFPLGKISLNTIPLRLHWKGKKNNKSLLHWKEVVNGLIFLYLMKHL